MFAKVTLSWLLSQSLSFVVCKCCCIEILNRPRQVKELCGNTSRCETTSKALLLEVAIVVVTTC